MSWQSGFCKGKPAGALIVTHEYRSKLSIRGCAEAYGRFYPTVTKVGKNRLGLVPGLRKGEAQGLKAQSNHPSCGTAEAVP
jgi:hypothetical protein